MTEHSLKRKSAIAIAWNFFDKVGSQLILIVIGLVVTRILSQKEYGLIGLLGIFIALSSALIDSGFVSALIRKKDASELDYNTVFYFNIGVSSFLYAVLFCCAPLIANFYNQPQLVILARVVFLSLIINSLGLVQGAQMTKNVRFKQLSVINLTSLLLSSILSLIFAVKGLGVWALVVQSVGNAAFRVSLLWVVSKWRPSRLFSFEALKAQLKYGMEMSAASLLTNLFQFLYGQLIGRFFPLTVMGNYTQASKYSDMPTSILSTTLSNSMFPIYSQIKDDPERLKRAFQKTIRLTSFLAFPLLFGLAIVGPGVLELLISKKWEGAFVYFQLLCLAGIPTIFINSNQYFVVIKDRVTEFVYIELVKIVILIIVFFSTVHYGIMASICGLVIMRYLIYILNVFILGNKAKYKWYEQWRDMAPYVLLSLVMVGIMYGLKFVIAQKLLLLVVQIFTGAAFYLGINKILKSKILDDVIALVLRK
ncbi:MAG: lipopolysaccharide biosynthesis protein [Bacteroidota bacterium]|nr:lipopolysaccharide biosynthesis protein [Bacteroidota bacterium]